MKVRLDHFFDIEEEHTAKEQKWGVQNHSPIEWCAILMEEVGEMAKESP